ncbi:hypothetical protein [Larkinella sp. C7]|jgi:hypothetical protein|uniref:hypothetical protein n=1 Tax=Larkinella sp. C7 TaxID=2576607 RepID=UPI0011110C37|nr:hypothetical protein [Larkinella sp. C7]
MAKGKTILFFLFGLAVISGGIYACKYYFSYRNDLADRPWAYSEDKAAHLLVGEWQGDFRDPDGVRKTMRLEILVPMTEEERAKKASRRTRRRRGLGSRSDQQRFDGFATVTSQRGIEEYECYGAVRDKTGGRLNTVHFRALDEKQQLRKNFNVLSAVDGGQWQNDSLMLTLSFTYTTATGSGYSSSADPRFDKKVTVYFFRMKS